MTIDPGPDRESLVSAALERLSQPERVEFIARFAKYAAALEACPGVLSEPRVRYAGWWRQGCQDHSSHDLETLAETAYESRDPFAVAWAAAAASALLYELCERLESSL